jgi:hypothetical protein
MRYQLTRRTFYPHHTTLIAAGDYEACMAVARLYDHGPEEDIHPHDRPAGLVHRWSTMHSVTDLSEYPEGTLYPLTRMGTDDWQRARRRAAFAELHRRITLNIERRCWKCAGPRGDAGIDGMCGACTEALRVAASHVGGPVTWGCWGMDLYYPTESEIVRYLP